MGTLFSQTALVLALGLAGFYISPDLAAITNTQTTAGSITNNHTPNEYPPVILGIGNLNLGVAAYDQRSGVGYVMYSEESVHSRFADTPPSQWNANHLIAVIYLDGEWKIDRNVFTLEPFVPRSSDVLLVEIDFGANSVSYLEGIKTSIEGIHAGYVSSDLTVIPETWGGEPDEGEFWIQGSEITIDNILPSVEIIEGPEDTSTITLNSPQFMWSGTDTDGRIDSFFVNLNGPSPSSLITADTSLQYSDLLNGSYEFCVTARDNAGTLSSSACRSFAIDVFPSNEPPTLSITNGPADSTIIQFNNPAFAWLGEDTDGTISNYLVVLEGPSPDSFATANTFVQYSARENGDYTFCVQAIDEEGAMSEAACRFFTIYVEIQNIPPVVSINNGPEEGSVIDFKNPAFSWTGEDSNGIVDSFFVEMRGPSFQEFSTTNTFHQFLDLLNGDHEFCVRASDNDGAYSQWTCRAFTIQIETLNVPPTVRIENGPAQNDTLSYNNPAFTWEGNDLDGTVDSFIVDLKGPLPSLFSTTATFTQFSALEDGNYAFCIQALDNEGALSEQACRQFSVHIINQNQPPIVAIENGPNDGNIITINNPAFTWNGMDTDGTVDIYNINLVGPTPVTITTSDTFYQFQPLASGTYSFCVQAIDNEGALSSWVCRQFEVNSTISGSIQDLFITAHGEVLAVPIPQQLLEIYQTDTRIASVTTNNQGTFSIPGQFEDGSYLLKTEFSETVEGLEDPIVIERVIPIHSDHTSEIKIPRSLARDQFEILAQLTNPRIDNNLIEDGGGYLSLGPIYDVEKLDALLRNWLILHETDIEAYLTSIKRMYIATEGMRQSLEEAVYLSHEHSETLLNMLRVYLTSHEVLSKIRTQLWDTTEASRAHILSSMLLYIDALVYEMTINTPVKYAATFTPSPYHTSLFETLLLMHDTILKEATFEPGVGTRFSSSFSERDDQNRMTLKANQNILSTIYKDGTQKLIDDISQHSVQFDVNGVFSDAFDAVLAENPTSIKSQRLELVQNTLLQSDSLQENAQSVYAAQTLALLVNSQASYTALNSAIEALNTSSFEDAGKALISTGKGLNELQYIDQFSAAYAFNPDTSITHYFTGHLAHPSESITRQISDIDATLEEYLNRLDNIMWLIQQGDWQAVVPMLGDLIELDRQYESSLPVNQGDLWMAAESVVANNPHSQEMYEALIRARLASIKHRIKLYTDLLQYADLQFIEFSALSAQRDSVMQSLHTTDLIAQELRRSIPDVDQPFITITPYPKLKEQIAPGIPTEIVIDVANIGTQSASQLSISLKTDSLATLLSPPTFIVPNLDPGQQATIRWEVIVQNLTHSAGLLIFEASIPEYKTVVNSTIYRPGVEPQITTSTEESSFLPAEYALHPNFPNPFSTETTLLFDLPKQGIVQISLYELSGREIANLVDESRPAGRHTINLKANGLKSGMYLLRFISGEFSSTRSILIVK